MLLCSPTDKQVRRPVGLDLVGCFSLDKILPIIGKDKGYFVYKGYMPNLSSNRLRLFKQEHEKGNLCCCCCGEQPTHFLLEKRPKDTNPHFNLYKVFEDDAGNKKYLLFTKDHIIPKSKGGKDLLSNYQLMCTVCNIEKGDMI